MTVTIDTRIGWCDVACVDNASRNVARIVETGARAYGVNIGVGALSYMGC